MLFTQGHPPRPTAGNLRIARPELSGRMRFYQDRSDGIFKPDSLGNADPLHEMRWTAAIQICFTPQIAGEGSACPLQ
jgi:hypothetical protein